MGEEPVIPKKVTICFISDTHRGYNDLYIPPCDILIHSGDDDLNDENSCIKLNEWFGKQPAKIILFVPGNHDFYAQDHFEEFKMHMFNCNDILIDKEYITDTGLRIYGSPFCPQFYDWAFMKPDLNLQKHWDLIPQDLDILVTHTPPYSILDTNSSYQYCGSQTLYKAVLMQNRNIKVHAFGHIHQGYGEKTIGNTRFINAAVCPVWDHNGYKTFEPIIIEL